MKLWRKYKVENIMEKSNNMEESGMDMRVKILNILCERKYNEKNIISNQMCVPKN